MRNEYEAICIRCRRPSTLVSVGGGRIKTYICPECKKEDTRRKIFYVSYAPLGGNSWSVSEFRSSPTILENLDIVHRHIYVSGYDGHTYYYVFVEEFTKSAALEKAELLILNFNDDPQAIKDINAEGLSPEEALVFDEMGDRYNDWMNNFSLPAKNHIFKNKESLALLYAVSKFVSQK